MAYNYPYWYILVSLLIAGLLSFITYRKFIKTSWEFNLMAFFRFLSYFILLLFVGELSIEKEYTNTEKSKLIVVYDNSESISNHFDVELIKDFRETLNNSGIKEKYDFEENSFDSEFNKLDSLTFNGSQSDFSSIEKSVDNFLNRGDYLLIISDGIQNSGKRAFLEEKAYSTLFLTTVDTLSKDQLKITNANYNRKVLENSLFPVEVFIESFNYNSSYVLEIYNENKLVFSEKSKMLSMDKITLRKLINLKSKNIGYHNYNIVLRNSKSEIISQKQIGVEVVKEKGRVLISYNDLNPDISFYKKYFEKHNYIVLLDDSQNPNTNNFDFVVSLANRVQVSDRVIILQQGIKAKSIGDFSFDDISNFYTLEKNNSRIIVNYRDLWKEGLRQARTNSTSLDQVLEKLFYELVQLKKSKSLSVDHKSIYSTNENVSIRLQGDQNTIETIDANLKLKGDSNRYESKFVNRLAYLSVNLGKINPGKYSMRIELSNKLYYKSYIEVIQNNLELLSVDNNELISNQLSKYSTNKIYNFSERDKLLEDLNNQKSEKTFKSIKNVNAINTIGFIVLILIFLSVEWYLRRRNALY